MPSLDCYMRKISDIKPHKNGGKISLHKPCLLLAIIEYAAKGLLAENRIDILGGSTLVDPKLVEIFKRYMKVANPDSSADIANPLARLRTDGFLELHSKPEGEPYAGPLPSNGGDDRKFLLEKITFIRLEDGFYELLVGSEKLREHLINTWFPKPKQRKKIEAAIDTGQRKLREPTLDNPLEIEIIELIEGIRKSPFRNMVLNAYDHRCAATGEQFLMSDGSSLLEAAHIRSFSKSHDDRIVNGIALSPNCHRAMSSHLISPGPDLIWHVSGTLDKRLGGDRNLLELKGEKILVPREKKYRPDENVLEWRLEKFHEMERQRR